MKSKRRKYRKKTNRKKSNKKKKKYIKKILTKKGKGYIPTIAVINPAGDMQYGIDSNLIKQIDTEIESLENKIKRIQHELPQLITKNKGSEELMDDIDNYTKNEISNLQNTIEKLKKCKRGINTTNNCPKNIIDKIISEKSHEIPHKTDTKTKKIHVQNILRRKNRRVPEVVVSLY